MSIIMTGQNELRSFSSVTTSEKVSCVYFEGHDEMGEVKLSLQIQLDGHIFHTWK